MLRFITSGTNSFNIDSLRLALLNFLWAKKRNQRFIIRQEFGKQSPEEDREVLNLLAIFGIEYDEVYYQNHNLKFYHQFAAQLLSNKKAFSCFCSSQTLQSKEESAQKNGRRYLYDGDCENLSDDIVLNNESPFTIRIKKPQNSIRINDTTRDEPRSNPEDIDSFVILNYDKSPMHDFANAIDDMLQGITHIILKEEDALSMTKQEHIRQSLGFCETITYSSLGPILYDGKLPTIQELLDEGFLPEAIMNYLIQPYINPTHEIFTLQNAIDWFDHSKLTCKSVSFDMDKLRQINRQYIMMLEPIKLAALLGFSGEDFGKIAKLYGEEFSTLRELKATLTAIFSKKVPTGGFEEEFKILQNALQSAPFFEDFDTFKSHISSVTKLTGDSFKKPFCTLLTGQQDDSKLEKLYPFIKNYLKEIVRT